MHIFLLTDISIKRNANCISFDRVDRSPAGGAGDDWWGGTLQDVDMSPVMGPACVGLWESGWDGVCVGLGGSSGGGLLVCLVVSGGLGVWGRCFPGRPKLWRPDCRFIRTPFALKSDCGKFTKKCLLIIIFISRGAESA